MKFWSPEPNRNGVLRSDASRVIKNLLLAMLLLVGTISPAQSADVVKTYLQRNAAYQRYQLIGIYDSSTFGLQYAVVYRKKGSMFISTNLQVLVFQHGDVRKTCDLNLLNARGPLLSKLEDGYLVVYQKLDLKKVLTLRADTIAFNVAQ